MIPKWDQTTVWQRVVLFVFTMILLIMGIQTWVWDSLDHSIMKLDQEIAALTHKSQESTNDIAVLHNVEQDVVALREKLAPGFTSLPRSIGPNVFRKDVVNIANRTSVVVHLWNPQQTLVKTQEPDSSLDIVVSVEGPFYDTVQFIHDVLKLSWVQTVNPMKLVRKQSNGDDSLVKTDFTIKGFVSKKIQQMDDLLKT